MLASAYRNPGKRRVFSDWVATWRIYPDTSEIVTVRSKGIDVTWVFLRVDASKEFYCYTTRKGQSWRYCVNLHINAVPEMMKNALLTAINEIAVSKISD